MGVFTVPRQYVLPKIKRYSDFGTVSQYYSKQITEGSHFFKKVALEYTLNDFI